MLLINGNGWEKTHEGDMTPVQERGGLDVVGEGGVGGDETLGGTEIIVLLKKSTFDRWRPSPSGRTLASSWRRRRRGRRTRGKTTAWAQNARGDDDVGTEHTGRRRYEYRTRGAATTWGQNARSDDDVGTEHTGRRRHEYKTRRATTMRAQNARGDNDVGTGCAGWQQVHALLRLRRAVLHGHGLQRLRCPWKTGRTVLWERSRDVKVLDQSEQWGRDGLFNKKTEGITPGDRPEGERLEGTILADGRFMVRGTFPMDYGIR